MNRSRTVLTVLIATVMLGLPLLPTLTATARTSRTAGRAGSGVWRTVPGAKLHSIADGLNAVSTRSHAGTWAVGTRASANAVCALSSSTTAEVSGELRERRGCSVDTEWCL